MLRFIYHQWSLAEVQVIYCMLYEDFVVFLLFISFSFCLLTQRVNPWLWMDHVNNSQKQFVCILAKKWQWMNCSSRSIRNTECMSRVSPNLVNRFQWFFFVTNFLWVHMPNYTTCRVRRHRQLRLISSRRCLSVVLLLVVAASLDERLFLRLPSNVAGNTEVF